MAPIAGAGTAANPSALGREFELAELAARRGMLVIMMVAIVLAGAMVLATSIASQ
jgi:hypothetical protein